MNNLVYDNEHFLKKDIRQMKQQGRILIVDDDEDILVAGKLLLGRRFSHVSTCSLPEHIPVFLKDQDFDAILLDMNFGPGESTGQQGFHWLQQIIALKPNSIVIMITAHGGVDVAVEAMKLGATDFIAKPWQNEKVIATVSTAVELAKTRNEAQALRQTNQALIESALPSDKYKMIGDSAPMQQVRMLIERSAPSDANVLILGENGTGKELVAREIHQQSRRAHNVFMSVDLGAISDTLFESELFGHKKGAFTGAQQERVGRLKAADGGTLFLDEIGNLPLHLQAKLLTVLEQRQVTPLGANQAIPIDVRVVAATNVERSVLTDESRFRQDLLFRLNTVEIPLPALRERTEDIVPIAVHFLEMYKKKYAKPLLSFSEQAKQGLKMDPWPGNIRALRHAIERAVILSVGDTITLQDFQLNTTPNVETTPPTQNSIPDHTNTDVVQNEGDLNLENLEKNAVSQALRKHRYNISKAAKELGLTRAALYRRMEKHGL